MKLELSIIIPTLNEEDSLAKTIDSLKDFNNVEIIIVDGGSQDRTVSIARNYGLQILHSKPNRGIQLQIGGNAAQASVLWFIHADAIPPPDAVNHIINVLEKTNAVAGNFTIRFDGERLAAKFLTWLYPQLRKIGLIYGDSAIFVRREVYQKIGGFKPYRLFEDLDLITRLKKEGNIITLSTTVMTSSRRFERRSFILTFLGWVLFQCLYWLGVTPNTLARYYYPVRKS